jgi:hypothetical protein
VDVLKKSPIVFIRGAFYYPNTTRPVSVFTMAVGSESFSYYRGTVCHMGVDRSHVNDFQRLEATRDILRDMDPARTQQWLRCTRVVKQQQQQQQQTMDDNGVAKVSLLTLNI